eukprot:CAMPEP_0176470740 /NCGR_PEP_ID=MMETSP0127-20121128/40659_1 /TAXON_ID=938130 /ORGANISM="Platyophrya macrostoma, Strain WH" /LENGTH=47 /DNA_ID= /DNA_START= /DNA_END= /DNA_ORIENTATION=
MGSCDAYAVDEWLTMLQQFAMVFEQASNSKLTNGAAPSSSVAESTLS